ncbi:MAG: DUF429 domain-containing protein [Pseudomonadota bacterium]
MSGSWVVGIDGCPGGWIAVGQSTTGDSSAPRVVVIPRLRDLSEAFGQVVLAGIDMPIGLSDAGPRRCDQLARGQLGGRASSVFPAPLRPALGAATHAEATRLSRAVGGRGVSAQAWNLFARVREVDEWLHQTPEWRKRVVEVHPELSFLALNDDVPLSASKHRIDGIYRRRALIAETFGWRAIESAVGQLAGTRVKEDDLLDAFAVLWSVRRWLAGEADCLPPDPSGDVRGLPMRIVF